MAIEEEQVRTIKEIFRTYYPHWYHSSLKTKTTTDATDQQKEIEKLKSQIK